jgi:predicted small lipoprotein YifL
VKFIVTVLLLLSVTASLNACGRRGDPEAPQLQQAQ